MIALTAICLALVALAAFREWQIGRERKDWTQERRLLLTRIQAPHMAAALATDDEVDPPSWVSPDDDDAFAEAMDERE